jgi:hypothetical protein
VKPLSPEQWRFGLAIDYRIGSRRRVQGEAHRRIATIASALGGIDILDDATQPSQQ